MIRPPVLSREPPSSPCVARRCAYAGLLVATPCWVVFQAGGLFFEEHVPG